MGCFDYERQIFMRGRRYGLTNFKRFRAMNSPDWCDVETWPEKPSGGWPSGGPYDSTWTLTAKSIAYHNDPNYSTQPDDCAVMINSVIVRFFMCVIHSGGDITVRYFSGTTQVGESIYTGRRDWERKAKRKGNIVTVASDVSAGPSGDKWESEINFIEDDEPVVLYPESMSSSGKLTKLTVHIADHEPYDKAVGSGNNQQWAYCRYPACAVFTVST